MLPPVTSFIAVVFSGVKCLRVCIVLQFYRALKYYVSVAFVGLLL